MWKKNERVKGVDWGLIILWEIEYNNIEFEAKSGKL